MVCSIRFELNILNCIDKLDAIIHHDVTILIVASDEPWWEYQTVNQEESRVHPSVLRHEQSPRRALSGGEKQESSREVLWGLV